MPLVNPLVIAPSHLLEFHESLFRIYARQTRMLKPAPPARTPPPYTHHCQCTISSLFVGPAQRSPLIIARDTRRMCAAMSARAVAAVASSRRKQRGHGRAGQIKSFAGARASARYSVFAALRFCDGGRRSRINGFQIDPRRLRDLREYKLTPDISQTDQRRC